MKVATQMSGSELSRLHQCESGMDCVMVIEILGTLFCLNVLLVIEQINCKTRVHYLKKFQRGVNTALRQRSKGNKTLYEKREAERSP